MDAAKLSPAAIHRFTVNMKLVENAFRAENSFVERGGVHGGLAPHHFNSQVVRNSDQAVKKSRAHAANASVQLPDDMRMYRHEIDNQAVTPTAAAVGEAVYVYYLPTYRLRAKEQGEKAWPCKIGRTDGDPLSRVLSQAATALPERPRIAIIIRTSYPIPWETALHGG